VLHNDLANYRSYSLLQRISDCSKRRKGPSAIAGKNLTEGGCEAGTYKLTRKTIYFNRASTITYYEWATGNVSLPLQLGSCLAGSWLLKTRRLPRRD
jgi:hypothetical protein